MSITEQTADKAGNRIFDLWKLPLEPSSLSFCSSFSIFSFDIQNKPIQKDQTESLLNSIQLLPCAKKLRDVTQTPLLDSLHFVGGDCNFNNLEIARKSWGYTSSAIQESALAHKQAASQSNIQRLSNWRDLFSKMKDDLSSHSEESAADPCWRKSSRRITTLDD